MSTSRTGCAATKHGTRTAYHNWGCRCDDAREAERIALKRRREGRAETVLVASIGTARRLQSLVAAGYSQVRLGRELGLSDQRIHQLITPTRNLITRDTEQAVRALFRRLDGTDGGSNYARTVSKKKGWHDAAVWDDIDDPHERPKLGKRNIDLVDEVLVERALEGRIGTRLSPANRVAAVKAGQRRGVPLKALSTRLHVSPRTTTRIAGRLARSTG